MKSKLCSCEQDEMTRFFQDHGSCMACVLLDGSEDEGFDSLELSGDPMTESTT